jgi:hypothetical protein
MKNYPFKITIRNDKEWSLTTIEIENKKGKVLSFSSKSKKGKEILTMLKNSFENPIQNCKYISGYCSDYFSEYYLQRSLKF